METNVKYTIVGSFVIILLAAFALGIIWLSSGFSFEKFKTYAIYMQESVSGLSIDSPVEYNGVSVGAVSSIELDNRNPHVVIILIKIKSDTPISKGTIATLNTRGITGITFVALKDKSTDLAPIRVLPGQKYPIIKTGPSLFTRLDTALSSLSSNLEQVSKSIQSLLNPENQQSIKEILSNLSRVTTTLVTNSRKFSILVENTSKASQQFSPLIRSSTNTMRTLETQTLPATYRMLNNLDNVSRTLTEISAEIKQNPSVLIRGSANKPLGPGETK